jgi:hypothetical protein
MAEQIFVRAQAFGAVFNQLVRSSAQLLVPSELERVRKPGACALYSTCTPR